LYSELIHICLIQSSKSSNGLSSNLFSQVKVISSLQTKIHNQIRNLRQVQDCHKNISFLGAFSLFNHQFIDKIQSFSNISIQKFFNASIIYFVSSDSRNQLNFDSHSAKLASIKSLFVIDLDQGRVSVFIRFKN
jgi:hypothetical protein